MKLALQSFTAESYKIAIQHASSKGGAKRDGSVMPVFIAKKTLSKRISPAAAGK